MRIVIVHTGGTDSELVRTQPPPFCSKVPGTWYMLWLDLGCRQGRCDALKILFFVRYDTLQVLSAHGSICGLTEYTDGYHTTETTY